MNVSQKSFVSKIWFELSKIDQFPVQEQVEIARKIVDKLNAAIQGPVQLKEFQKNLARELAEIDAETAKREKRQALEAAARQAELDRKAAEEAAKNTPQTEDAPAVDTVSEK